MSVLFYDCTTLYFESFEPDDLRQKGFSKDRKASETQVLLALVVSEEGLPVGYEVFPGATFEGHTLIPILQQLKQRFDITRVVFVADRGLFNKDNLDALEAAKVEYVVGTRLKNQSEASDTRHRELHPAVGRVEGAHPRPSGWATYGGDAQ